jgi:hypothetical protein
MYSFDTEKAGIEITTCVLAPLATFMLVEAAAGFCHDEVI